jgi:O-acetyl-ADP-ribose deacetylase (regulator of RNase III)
MRKISAIAIPPLGAGLGGREWDDVKGKIEMALSQLTDVDIEVYEP